MMRLLAAILLFTLAACNRTPADPPADPAYRAEVEAWQKRHTEGMKRDWGTLAGLFWLAEGENPFGSDPGNHIVLPKKAPAKAGVFTLGGSTVTAKLLPGPNFTLDGKPVKEATLKPDTAEKPDVLELGTLSVTVLDREGRYGIRVRDTDGPEVAKFQDLKYFPIQERYRVRGRLVRSPEPMKITVPAENMKTQTLDVPGYVEFTLLGRDLRLYPSLVGKRLFFIFKDETSKTKLTYPAARYMYSDLGQNDEVVVDFNQSYSPPCAFTPYATCPLAPEQNVLPVAIEAGEIYTHP
ncbi:MAG: DUF1684 domain-containing protein [Candidatus Korobacteraceae bacterium]